jgi:hypothetical protein
MGQLFFATSNSKCFSSLVCGWIPSTLVGSTLIIIILFVEMLKNFPKKIIFKKHKFCKGKSTMEGVFFYIPFMHSSTQKG